MEANQRNVDSQRLWEESEYFSKGLSIVKLLKTVEFKIKNVVVTEVTIRFVLNKGIVKLFEKEEGLKVEKT